MDILYKEKDTRGVKVILTMPENFKPPRIIVLEADYPTPIAVCERQYEIVKPT